jgi:hypothetical protein
MNEIIKNNKNFVGYEYKEILTSSDKVSMYLDGFENFGWEVDEHMGQIQSGEKIRLKLKRDRKILNKVELTRLQRNFEACMEEIDSLEKSIKKTATMMAIIIGIIGTVFMAGSVFAVTNEPPIIWLSVLLAIPAFIGWISPIFVYKKIMRERAEEIVPFIEQKQEEIYELCEKGSKLL